MGRESHHNSLHSGQLGSITGIPGVTIPFCRQAGPVDQGWAVIFSSLWSPMVPLGLQVDGAHRVRNEG